MGPAIWACCVKNNGLWKEGYEKGHETAQEALHFMSRILKVIGGLQNFPLELLTDLCHDYYLILINHVALPFAKASKCCLWVMDSCEILDELHMKKTAYAFLHVLLAYILHRNWPLPSERGTLPLGSCPAFKVGTWRLFSIFIVCGASSSFVSLHRHPRCPQPFSPWILNQSPFAQQAGSRFCLWELASREYV